MTVQMTEEQLQNLIRALQPQQPQAPPPQQQQKSAAALGQMKQLDMVRQDVEAEKN